MIERQFTRTREITARARALRKTLSRSEARLWPHLRKAALGASFRRQHPIGPYFADYCCAALKIVVEIDGDGHDSDRDARRDAYMQSRGFKVLRFGAEETWEGLGGVVEAIRYAIIERQLEREGVFDGDC